METAGDIIRDSLQEILVQDSEQPMTPSETQAAIRYLNRMMASWDLMGISLGFTSITKLSDPVTVADGALSAIVYNLALKLAPQFDIQPSPLLVLNAREAMGAVRSLAVVIEATCLPETLPLGSGNEGETVDSLTHFFPPKDDDMLTEQGNNIELESGT